MPLLRRPVSYTSFAQAKNLPHLLFLPLISNTQLPPHCISAGFSGENITDFLLVPDQQGHVYASVGMQGLFETRDGGVHWEHLIATRVHDITSQPQIHTTLYLATWSSYGLYWSENGGSTWEPIPGWASLSPTLYSVAVHPHLVNVIFAGSGNWEPVGGEIFKTIDGGEQWFPVSAMFTNALTFVFDPISSDVIYAGTRYAGVQKSTDTGSSWFPVNSGMPIGSTGAHDIYSLVLNPNNHQQIFVATSRGVYASENGANTWESLWEGVDANSIVFHPTHSSDIYLGAETGLFVSYNYGLTWYPSGVTHPIDKLAFDPFDHNKLWIATRNGIWRCMLN